MKKTDLKDFISTMLATAPPSKGLTSYEIVSFLRDNDWFGEEPAVVGKAVLLDDRQIELYTPPLQEYIQHYGDLDYLIGMLRMKFPDTTKLLTKFFNEEDIADSTRLYLFSFIRKYLKKDIVLYSDTELKEFVNVAEMELIKEHGVILTFFFSWVRARRKTRYYMNYFMEQRYKMTIQSQAYAMDEYLSLMYYLFCKEYIEENSMYIKAAESQAFTDTWLYLSMCLICSIRFTDLERMYHPDLPYPPEEVLARVKDGSFSEADARLVLLSITSRLAVLPLFPNKTSGTNGVPPIRIVFPNSCESHFGTLFAVAEAHRQVNGKPDSPIIRKITTYKDITKNMGEEIGSLFLESDFRSRSATKSYLQGIYMCANEMADDTDGLDIPHVQGYLLAARARSHKSSYGSFAATTFEYLKDAKLNGLTPEFIAYELLERGVLSFVSDLLLQMISGDEYKRLSVSAQTKAIQALALSPGDVETIISTVSMGKKRAERVLKEAIASEEEILTVLHRIGSGVAFSKQSESLCLNTALGHVCPYPEKRQCIGCEYEISTKSTFFLLISEINRMRALFREVQNPLEKRKYQSLVTEVFLPKLDEMLYVIQNQYGEEIAAQYNKMLEDYIQ